MEQGGGEGGHLATVDVVEAGAEGVVVAVAAEVEEEGGEGVVLVAPFWLESSAAAHLLRRSRRKRRVASLASPSNLVPSVLATRRAGLPVGVSVYSDTTALVSEKIITKILSSTKTSITRFSCNLKKQFSGHKKQQKQLVKGM